jgi:hypothetical protein
MTDMKKNISIRFITSMLVAAIAFTAITGCNTKSINAEITQEAQSDSESITLTSGPLTAEYKKKDLDTDYSDVTGSAVCGTKTAVSGKGISEENGVITISKEGTYVLSGDYSGQVLVDADKDAYVHIVLDGFNIVNESGPAIYSQQCDKLTITLADGSENSVADGAEYTSVDEDGEPDGAIYSKTDLSINGNGSIEVTGNYADAIKCKKDLKLISGSYKIKAASEGIKGRNSVVIKDGTYDITSTDTAIKATRDDDADKGYIIIDGGDITINAGNDGIHSETHTTINGGNINIETSYEGIEGQMIDITGGEVNVYASDDGINASRIGSSSNKGGKGGMGGGAPGMPNGNGDQGNAPQMPNDNGDQGNAPQMPNGNGDQGDMPQMPQGDGEQGDKPQMPQGDGEQGDRPQMPQGDGDQGDKPQMPQGNGNQGDKPDMSQDNNADGKGDKGMRGFGGGMEQESSDGQVYINISGGKVTVTAANGDCIDANGDLYISGGEVYASSERYGITDPDAVLDADASIVLKEGATFIGTGTSSQISSIENEQNAIYMYLDEKQQGTITVYNGSEKLAEYTPKYTYSGLVITSPKFEIGKTYTVEINGEKTDVTLTEQVTTVGTASAGGMGGGKGGDDRGQSQMKFTDISKDDDCYKAVAFLSRTGAMSGTSDTEFSPNTTLTRAMAVSVLGRLAKGEATGTASGFTDVEEGTYYIDYVNWAAENNIVSGYGNGVFGVNDSITGKQLQIILSNYAKTAGIEFTADESADDTPVTRGEFAQALYNAFGSSFKNDMNKAK